MIIILFLVFNIYNFIECEIVIILINYGILLYNLNCVILNYVDIIKILIN